MGRKREPLFASDNSSDDSLGDLSRFQVKKRDHRDNAPKREALRDIGHSTGFQSREPRELNAPVGGRGRHVTGRNAQINLKARPEVIEAFSAIADRYDWSKALTFERAVAALERLLADDGVDPKSLDEKD